MNTTIAWVNIMKEEYRFLGVRMMKNTFADRRMERMMAKWGIRAKFGRRKWNDKRIFWIFTQQEISWLFRTTLIKLTNQYSFFFCEMKTALLDWGSHWLAGPSDYSILDSNSEFFVILELDSDQTLLGPSSEYYKLQDFHDYFNNYSEAAGNGEDISG